MNFISIYWLIEEVIFVFGAAGGAARGRGEGSVGGDEKIEQPKPKDGENTFSSRFFPASSALIPHPPSMKPDFRTHWEGPLGALVSSCPENVVYFTFI